MLTRYEVFGKSLARAGNYRIPAILLTKHGTLVACADERWFGGGDNPNRIDKVVRRSSDGGETWGETIVLKKEFGERKLKASASIDPCLLYDEKTDTIFCIFAHTPSGVGILTSVKGKGLTADGDRILYGDNKKAFLRDGKIFVDNLETAMTVDKDGNIADKAGQNLGNINVGGGKFKEKNTFFLCISHSCDDGLTWSEPVCLNNQVKEDYMSFLGAGPGVGLVIKNGAHAGRYVFPIYYNTASGAILMLSAAMIYSDDQGKTWQRGKSPNHARKHGIIPICPRFLLPFDQITETQLIELPDGSLKLFMRNHAGKKLIMTAISDDGGESWRDCKFQPQLDQPICQCSVITANDNGRVATLFLNAASKTARTNGTIRLSYDYGETFEYSRSLKDGDFVYSSMAQLPDGQICALYETSTQHESIELAKFPIDWIKEN
ncbi:MAG: sialidase family protein [Clostridia bacterium]